MQVATMIITTATLIANLCTLFYLRKISEE